jgi:hypothetical protein
MKRAQARLAAAKGVGPGSAGFVGMPGPGLNE